MTSTPRTLPADFHELVARARPHGSGALLSGEPLPTAGVAPAPVPEAPEGVASIVLEQTKRFRAALPRLLVEHPRRWVVFYDEVLSVHSDEGAALAAAVRRFGPDGGFVVARVQPESRELLNPALAFGARDCPDDE